MTQTNYDANNVLMGGGGPPAWKFEDAGTTREGTISAPPQARQERDFDPNNPGGGALKVFPSGDPIMGVLVEVQGNERANHDDDGKRTFYVEGRWLKEAVRNAVRAAGANGLEVGGHLKVTFTHREDPMDKRSRKFWNVVYTPAGNAALMGEPAVPAQADPLGDYSATGGAVQGAPADPWAAPVAPPVQTAPANQPTAEQLAAFEQWKRSQQQSA